MFGASVSLTMPLGAKDRGLLADALGKVTGLSPMNRKDIKDALKSLPSLSALTGGIARAKKQAQLARVRKRKALPWTPAQLAVPNTVTHKPFSTTRVRDAASVRGVKVTAPKRTVLQLPQQSPPPPPTGAPTTGGDGGMEPPRPRKRSKVERDVALAAWLNRAWPALDARARLGEQTVAQNDSVYPDPTKIAVRRWVIQAEYRDKWLGRHESGMQKFMELRDVDDGG